MGLDDITRKATEFLKSEKARETLRSEKAEGVSDTILERAADLADKATGGKHSEQIENARAAADKKIGDR